MKPEDSVRLQDAPPTPVSCLGRRNMHTMVFEIKTHKTFFSEKNARGRSVEKQVRKSQAVASNRKTRPAQAPPPLLSFTSVGTQSQLPCRFS